MIYVNLLSSNLQYLQDRNHPFSNSNQGFTISKVGYSISRLNEIPQMKQIQIYFYLHPNSTEEGIFKGMISGIFRGSTTEIINNSSEVVH